MFRPTQSRVDSICKTVMSDVEGLWSLDIEDDDSDIQWSAMQVKAPDKDHMVRLGIVQKTYQI